MKSSTALSGLAGFLLIGFVAISLLSLSNFSTLAQGAEPLSHDPIITISPNIASCGDLPNDFTVNVYNDGGYGIYNVKIYKAQTNIVDLTCGDAPPGWIFKGFLFGLYCEYETNPEGNDVINATEYVDFTFEAVIDQEACVSTFRITTLDNEAILTGGGQGTEENTFLDLNVDCEDPTLYKEVIGPQVGNPTCPPSSDGFPDEECWVANHETEIYIQVFDEEDPCDLGIDFCTYQIYLDGALHYEDTMNPGEPVPFMDWTVVFTEDSVHDLYIYCEDIAGNYFEDWERFRVDSTPPETIKVYGDPHFPVDINSGAPYPHWISLETPITLTTEDPDWTGYGCAIGVDKLYYRDFVVDDWFCENEYIGGGSTPDMVCPDCDICHPENYGNPDVPFEETDNLEVTFYKDEESCHVIEFYAVDELGNEEPLNFQCVYVEDTPPVLWKVHGDGLIEDYDDEFMTDSNPEGMFHWMTQDMSFDLYCEDQGDHPVDHVTLYWRIWNDITETWTGWDSSTGESVHEEIFFGEDSVHKIQYYCEDILGNTDGTEMEPYEQVYRVDTQPPEITKEMFGSWLGDCPPAPGSGDVCYVADNDMSGVEIFVEDMGDICHIGIDYCEYEITWLAAGVDPVVVETGEFTDYQEIIFQEDSTHELYIYCIDDLGNWFEETETFLVDSTPPETVKTYGEPAVPEGINEGAPYPHWITSDTSVTLTAEDNKVGVDKTYWRNFVIEDPAGWDVCYIEDACHPEVYYNYVDIDAEWNEYLDPFYKPQESCHVIEYYSVDKLGNTEDMHWQCVFVDNTPPEGEKVIGDPHVIVETSCEPGAASFGAPIVTDGGTTIEPSSVTATLNPGETVSEHKVVTTAEVPITSLDVLFEFDLTGSMSGELSSAKSSAIDIMNDIKALVPDAQFGVGSFMDYDGYFDYCGYYSEYGDASGFGDYPWSLDQDITDDTTAVSTAINGLVLGYGADGPEAYARALFEANGVTWREGARKVVVIFQDNVPHDCDIEDYCPGEFYDGTTGVDPGSDAVAGTGDDLPWDYVVQQLADAGISVVVVEAEFGSCEEIWQYAADETGGIFAELGSASGLPAEIVALIEEVTATIDVLTLEPEAGYEAWVEWTPEAYYGVNGSQTVEFDVDITVPGGTAPGTYHFVIKVVGDGSTLAEEDVWITVPGDECIEEIIYVTTQTPIDLTCTDPEPHPVDNSIVWWRFSWWPEGFGGPVEYSDWYSEDHSVTVYFPEDSWHDLEYYCEDALGNENEVDTEYFIVETEPPIIEKEIVGPWYGDCPPTPGSDEVCYLDGVTEIHTTVYDPMPHPVDDVECYYWYYVHEPDLDPVRYPASGVYGLDLVDIINFPEESKHELHIVCHDALGNEVEDVEWFTVDKTPPYLTKWFGDPYFTDDIAEWVTTQTPMYIDAYDQEPHPSGLNEVRYRITLSDNEEACWNDVLCDEEIVDGDWSIYEGEDIFIPEESCHIIEIEAEDNVEKTAYHRQCVFVDDTAPEIFKTIGDPNIQDADPEFEGWVEGGVFHWVTQNTEITLTCEDLDPHPVGHETAFYRIWNDITEQWTDWMAFGEPFAFTEDSVHRLQYYCEDVLGNGGDIHEQVYRVDSTPPEFWKEIGDPQYQCDYGIDVIQCEGWDCLKDVTGAWDHKDFFVTGRSDTTNWDMAIWNGDPEQVETQGEFAWVNAGEPVPFTVIYNSETGLVTYDVDGTVLTWTYDTGKAFDYLVLMSKGGADKGDTALLDVYVNGNYIGDVISEGDYAGFKVHMGDATQMGGFVVTGFVTMIWEDGHPQEIPAFHVFAMNTHDADGCYISSETDLCLYWEDGGEVCHVDDVTCYWGYYWEDTGEEFHGWYEYNPDTCINLPEDSNHELMYYCEDALGNSFEPHTQPHAVDNTPPESSITEPHQKFAPGTEDGKVEVCWESWDEKSGVDYVTVYWKDVDGEWNVLVEEGDPEGCTLFEQGYYNMEYCFKSEAVDNIGNMEMKDEADICSTVVEYKFRIRLHNNPDPSEWNLISIPVMAADGNIEVLTEDIQEELNSVWTYDAATDQWFVYWPDDANATNLNKMEPGWGYWVGVSEDAVLEVGGSLMTEVSVPPTRTLVPGWNLIGYYGIDNPDIMWYPTDPVSCPDLSVDGCGPQGNGKPAYCALYTLTTPTTPIPNPWWNSLWGYWNEWHPRFYSMSNMDNLDPGAGYWIHMNNEKDEFDYTVPTPPELLCGDWWVDI